MSGYPYDPDAEAAEAADHPAFANVGPKSLSRQPVTEEGLHVQVAKFLNEKLTGKTWWSTMPLGGGGLLRGAKLKRAGTRRGLPDILVIDNGRACWIELKRPKGGYLSDAQAGVHAQLRRAGTPVDVCRSLDEVIEALSVHGVPMRGINA